MEGAEPVGNPAANLFVRLCVAAVCLNLIFETAPVYGRYGRPYPYGASMSPDLPSLAELRMERV